MGTYLGREQRKDFSARVYMAGDHGTDGRRTARKQCLTDGTSSSWAGSITRTSNTVYNTGIANLKEELKYLCAATSKIKSRLTVPVGEYDKKKKVRGYHGATEVALKKRRLGVLQDRLAGVKERLKKGRPQVVIGGSGLYRHKENLEAAGLTAEQWRDQWEAARMFLTADGTSEEVNVNQTIRVTPEGKVRIKIPGALVEMFGIGEHLELASPVKFYNKAGDLQDRISTNQAIRYDTDPKHATKPWSLSASWKIKQSPYLPTPAHLTFGNQLAVDCNDQFFSCRG